jgi:sarcosine oxidase, subunit beta
MADIVIIGGGITGTAAALELADAGHAVVLLEKHAIAAMASGWTLGGVRQSGRDPAELPLASAAVAIWPSLNDKLGADVEYRQHGNLRLARDENEVETIRELVERQRKEDLELDFLASNAEVRAMAPAISDRVLAASFCPSDGHANPILTTRAFAEAARRQGAVIREGVEARAIRVRKDRIAGVETSEGFLPAAAVVVAAGVNTPRLIAPLGFDLPLTVTVVHVLQTEPLPATLQQVFGVANADCAGRQEVDGRLRVTSGSRPWAGDLANWNEEALKPTAADLGHLTHLVGHVLPILNRAPAHRVWGGLIDLTPDALPVLDAPSAVGGLVVAAGFSGHGFCLGPISGKLIADLALGRPARIDLASFRLDRFAAGVRRSHAALTLHG